MTSVYAQVVQAIAVRDKADPIQVINHFNEKQFIPTGLYNCEVMDKDYTVVVGINKKEALSCGFVLELQTGKPEDETLAEEIVSACLARQAPETSGALAKQGKPVLDGTMLLPAIRSGLFGAELATTVCANGQEMSCVALTNKEVRQNHFATADAKNKMGQLKSNIDLRHRLRMKYEAKKAAAAAAK